MPLTINVGLSRKTSENYNSAGTSTNLTAELDQSLLVRPGELQQAIDELYAEAEQALERQAASPNERDATTTTDAHRAPRRSSDQPRDIEHHRNANGAKRSDRPKRMTQSQERAIHAIAKRLDIDPARECQQVIGRRIDELNIREASRLIDKLKQQNQQPTRSHS